MKIPNIKNPTKDQRAAIKAMKEANHSHRVWHRFSNWITKTYGEDLWGKWQTMGKGKKKIRFRSFDDYKLSQRLVGYEVMTRVKRYVTRHCPEIRIVSCDDSVYAGSDILLIPHPKHGITVLFIPQCTTIQNQFFLYGCHYRNLMSELRKMRTVYPSADLRD